MTDWYFSHAQLTPPQSTPSYPKSSTLFTHLCPSPGPSGPQCCTWMWLRIVPGEGLVPVFQERQEYEVIIGSFGFSLPCPSTSISCSSIALEGAPPQCHLCKAWDSLRLSSLSLRTPTPSHLFPSRFSAIINATHSWRMPVRCQLPSTINSLEVNHVTVSGHVNAGKGIEDKSIY